MEGCTDCAEPRSLELLELPNAKSAAHGPPLPKEPQKVGRHYISRCVVLQGFHDSDALCPLLDVLADSDEAAMQCMDVRGPD